MSRTNAVALTGRNRQPHSSVSRRRWRLADCIAGGSLRPPAMITVQALSWSASICVDLRLTARLTGTVGDWPFRTESRSTGSTSRC